MTADDPAPDKIPDPSHERQPDLQAPKPPSAKLRKALIAVTVLSAGIALVSTALLAYSLLAEPRSASYSTASLSTINCSDSMHCENTDAAPACADTKCAVCDSLRRKCIYRLKPDDPACVCLQYDVEICDLDGGGWGVKKCRVTPDQTETYWGRCAEL
jgi:hypothetical protein